MSSIEIPVKLSTPLGGDVLKFRRMTATESLGRLFEINLEMAGRNESIDFNDLLGQTITVELILPSGKTRYFTGFVSKFSQTGTIGRNVVYNAVLRPWLWILTRAADCRIFQESTAPEIIKTVFNNHGFTDIKDALSGAYRTWEYCAQYRETDFNFVSRLMEQEGIYYYFQHFNGKHTLVLSDSISSHEKVEDYESIHYYPPSENAIRGEHVDDWSTEGAVQPGACALNDYDFKRPKAGLGVCSSVSRSHAMADFEVYDYPGEYVKIPEGENYARARIQEFQAQHLQVGGHGNVKGLTVGALFHLEGFPREDQNKEYLVVQTSHFVELASDESGVAQGEMKHSCTFSAIPSSQEYRSSRITPKPSVQGPQTAVVVGPRGEEIWTDKYGRVKVQFHWDRIGAGDENSSCWMRVAQPWAGKNWGAVYIPRIGQEVVVEFLEGDPDRPIVTGSVYNEDVMPPFDLPGSKTISGVKSNSSKGGGGYNEIIMDDAKGNELIRIHGQFDMDSTVENDLREHVFNNRTRDVGSDETVQVGNNQTLNVGNDQTYGIGKNQAGTVGADKSVRVGANHDEAIGANMTVSIGGGKVETVGKDASETISADKTVTVGGVHKETVGKDKTEEIGANKTLTIGGDLAETIGKGLAVTVGAGASLEVTKDYSVKAKKIAIEASDELSIKVGSAKLVMKKNGDITISGKKIQIKGSGDVIIKGSKISQN